VIIALVFEKNAIFRRKLAKIAENCDHSIDPRLGEFSLLGWLFILGSYLKITQLAQFSGLLFPL
jgi:hypothetical protein